MFMTIIAYSNNITQYGTDMCVPGIADKARQYNTNLDAEDSE